MKKKLLILSEGYPSTLHPYSMSFVHSRNIEYRKFDVDVDVISFSTDTDYRFEEIDVYSPSAKLNFNEYAAIVAHAPNLRHHLKFLLKNISSFNLIIFVFHGHEALPLNKYYPAPYKWNRGKFFKSKQTLQAAYDFLKLLALKLFIFAFSKKLRIFYVSNWMKTEAERWIGMSAGIKTFIINNPINSAFQHRKYNRNINSHLDFVSIRPLDDPKYCMDIIVGIANLYPELNFTIFGKGRYFEENDCPPNIHWHNQFVLQKDIPDLLNNFRAALMPTRLDAQGVMTCEMACYGIPVVTSDIPVCHEMLGGLKNVKFISNSMDEVTLDLTTVFDTYEVSESNRFDPRMIAGSELEAIFNA